ncbi:MAG: hypothetical protein QM504_02870 [Pseudomonadota bacterium]
MIISNPVDEYIFWKQFIDNKLKIKEPIPGLLYELLDSAETHMLFYLMDKHHILNSEEKSLISIH